MASILDLNSDCSDSEDDCDYVPDEGEISDPSPAEDSEVEEGTTRSGTKRKRQRKVSENSAEENDKVEKKLSEEEEKRRADELFKEFLGDVEPVSTNETSKSLNTSKNSETDSLSKITVTEEYEFAGETVKVTKEVDVNSSASMTKPIVTSGHSNSNISNAKPALSCGLKKPGGLSSVVGVLSKKKQKLSTLQKSLLDWNSFKKDEGIEEELEQHNKGKGGFLERQAFLQRSDLRQFEIEKNIRLKRRKQ